MKCFFESTVLNPVPIHNCVVCGHFNSNSHILQLLTWMTFCAYTVMKRLYLFRVSDRVSILCFSSSWTIWNAALNQSKCNGFREDKNIKMLKPVNLVAGFQCVLQLQTDVVTLHVGVEIFLINSDLKLCRFSQSVKHLDKNEWHYIKHNCVNFFFPSQWTITNTFCFSFSVLICLFFSTKLKRASCSLVNPISFFFSCRNKHFCSKLILLMAKTASEFLF